MGLATSRAGEDGEGVRDRRDSGMLGRIEVGEEDVGIHRLKSRR